MAKYLHVIYTSLFIAIISQSKADPGTQISKNDEALLNWTAPEEFKTEFPCYLMGYDYENKPVLLLEWGKWTTFNITTEGGKPLENLEKMQDQFVERLATNFFKPPTNPSEGTNDDEFVLLIDLDQYKYTDLLSQPTTKYLTTYFAKLNRVSGKFAYGIVINVSAVGEHFFTLFKIVAGKYVEGSDKNGTNKTLWIPRILKKIPKNQLLPKYGGDEGYKPISHCVKYSNPHL